MNGKKKKAKYPKLCPTVKHILLFFPNSYIVESGVSHVHHLRCKQTLPTENLLIYNSKSHPSTCSKDYGLFK